MLTPENAGWVGFDLAEHFVDRAGVEIVVAVPAAVAVGPVVSMKYAVYGDRSPEPVFAEPVVRVFPHVPPEACRGTSWAQGLPPMRLITSLSQE